MKYAAMGEGDPTRQDDKPIDRTARALMWKLCVARCNARIIQLTDDSLNFHQLRVSVNVDRFMLLKYASQTGGLFR